MRRLCSLMLAYGILIASAPLLAQDAEQPQAIQPEAVDLGRPVDFAKDIVPILDQNCVACHNVAINESQFVLEDVESMLKGGKRGAAVVPGKPDESLLFQVAARGKEPVMPPMPNEMDAKPLTPQQLGLLRQWILEGAQTSGSGRPRQVEFHPIPDGRHAIYSVAASPWGRYAASGRANQILLYDLGTGEEIARLTDPALDGVEYEGQPMYPGGAAHRDFVHSLAFSPDGTLLASGGYRVVKLWKQSLASTKLPLGDGAQPVTAVAATRDGKLAAVATADNTIRLIRLADNQPGPVLSGHAGRVTALEFSPDGNRLFSSSLDQSIRLWNPADGASLGRIDTPAPVNDITLNKEATQVISAGADNLIRVWNAPAAPPAQLAATEAPVLATAVSSDRKWLAVATEDGKVLLDLATGQAARTLAGHSGAVHSIAFSANNARLVTGGADQTVRIWDVANGQPIAVLAGGTGAVSAVALHPNGNQVVSAAADANTASVWKLDVPATRPLAGENGIPVKVAAVSADGRLLAVGATADGKPVILVREIASGNVTQTLAGHEGAITAVAFSPDASKLVSGSDDKTARVWNLADAKELAKFAGHTGAITGVAFNSNAQQVLSGSADNSLKLWNTADGAELKNFAGHTGAIAAVALPNDQTVVSASADQTIRVWNPADGAQVRAIQHGQPVTSLALTRDGAKLAATGTDQHVKLYQTADGNPLATLSAHTAAAKHVAFLADGTRLVSSGDDQQVIVWDVATSKPLERLMSDKAVTAAVYSGAADGVLIATDDHAVAYHTLRLERIVAGHDQPISDILYAPDGNSIYTSSNDGTVRRFQVANGQQQFAAGHGAPIHDLALSPNGQLLASAGENNQVRIWNAGNGANGPRPSLDGFEAPVRSVAFTGDNNRVVAGTANNQVRVYHLQSGAVEQFFMEHTGSVEALTVAGEQGDRVISASADKTVRTWSVAALSQISGHGQPVTSVELILPAGQQIVSGSQDSTVRIWNLANGQQVRAMNHGGAVHAVAARPDGQAVASAGANNMAKLWKADNGQQLAELKGRVDRRQDVARRSEDQRIANELQNQANSAATAAEKAVTDGEAALKTAQEALTKATEALAEPQKKLDETRQALEAAKTALAAKPDDGELQKKVAEAQKPFDEATAKLKEATDARDAADRSMKLADEALNREKQRRDEANRAKEAAATRAAEAKTALEAAQKIDGESHKPVQSVGFSPDGKLLVTGGDDHLLHVWSAADGSPLEVREGHQGPVTALAFAGDRGVVSGSADQTAVSWSLRPAWTLAGRLGVTAEAPLDLASSPFVDRVLALDFSPDGKLLATGGGDPSRSGELMLWSVAEGTVVRQIEDAHSDTVLGVEFSRDGQRLLSGGTDKFAKVFEVETGKHIRSYEGHTHHVMGVSWKGDGTQIVTAGADNQIKIWNTETGEQNRTIQNYPKQVTAIQYVGDSDTIASCGGDATVRFHRGANGQNYRNFGGATDYVYAVAVARGAETAVNPQTNRDCDLILAGGEDGTLRVWNAQNGQALFTFAPPEPDAQASR